MSDGITDTPHSEHVHQPAAGLRRWLYTTNHKDIGTLYLCFALTMFFTGGAMAMVIRAELFQPLTIPSYERGVARLLRYDWVIALA